MVNTLATSKLTHSNAFVAPGDEECIPLLHSIRLSAACVFQDSHIYPRRNAAILYLKKTGVFSRRGNFLVAVVKLKLNLPLQLQQFKTQSKSMQPMTRAGKYATCIKRGKTWLWF